MANSKKSESEMMPEKASAEGRPLHHFDTGSGLEIEPAAAPGPTTLPQIFTTFPGEVPSQVPKPPFPGEVVDSLDRRGPQWTPFPGEAHIGPRP